MALKDHFSCLEVTGTLVDQVTKQVTRRNFLAPSGLWLDNEACWHPTHQLEHPRIRTTGGLCQHRFVSGFSPPRRFFPIHQSAIPTPSNVHNSYGGEWQFYTFSNQNYSKSSFPFHRVKLVAIPGVPHWRVRTTRRPLRRYHSDPPAQPSRSESPPVQGVATAREWVG